MMNGSQFFCCVIMVSDLERSTRFYRDGLGFKVGKERSPNGGAMGVTGRFMKKDGLLIELVAFEKPLVFDGSVKMVDSDAAMPTNTSVQPCDQLGMVSHVVFDCVDTSVEEAAILANGGTVGQRASVQLPDGIGTMNFVFVRDPDGLWLELLHFENEQVRNRYVGFPD
jgi:catechol 2,3-dioxygenase-like lactoylglutathione lyase family enzyme